MVKRRPGVSILPLMLIVILCVSWLTQLNQRDEMTYDEMVQLFEQQKVEAFRFTDSSTLMLQVKGSDQPVRCRIHDYTLFYSDLNDLVKEQKAAGIIKSYSYPPPEGTDWLGIMLPYLMMALMFIPAAVGLMASWSVIKENLLAYLVIAVVTTVVVMAVSGLVTQAVLKKGKKGAEKE